MKNFKLQLCYISIFLGLSASAFAQKQANILDWKTDVSLNTYLVQQMKEQYDARANELTKALTSKERTLAYIKSVKEKFKTVLGDLPEKANANAQITGVIQQDGYKIERIVYQSFQNHHVTANLYVPNGTGKFPAVLLFCGHEDLAKATISYQQTAILFAKNGFIVFVIDPVSQSERVQLTDKTGKALTRGATTEHTLLNLSSNLLGTSVAAYELFDNVCGLDYLTTRPEVDTTKIGCIGNSGGAMQAIYFAAFDDRVKVIAPCSYLASREKTFATTGAADGCAQIPNEGLEQLEMSDYLIAAAPKPILVLAGRYDFIDYNGTLQSFDELQRVYKRLSSADQLSLFTYDDGHGLSKPKREAAVQWFRKWFYDDDSPVKEGLLFTLTDKDLFTTSKGKVSIDYLNEVNISQNNQGLFNKKIELRKAFALLPEMQRKYKIEKLLGIHQATVELEVEHLETVPTQQNRLIIRKKNELPLPVHIYYPKITAKRILISINDDKTTRDSVLKELIAKQSDEIILSVDLRGTGETTDKPEMNDQKYASKDYRNAMLALHQGKPLVGQRVNDILNVIGFINGQTSIKDLPIAINAVGLVGLAGLHAAFINPAIGKIDVYQCVTSYETMLYQPLAKDRYGAVIANVLSYYDVPDLVNWIGRNKVQFHP